MDTSTTTTESTTETTTETTTATTEPTTTTTTESTTETTTETTTKPTPTGSVQNEGDDLLKNDKGELPAGQDQVQTAVENATNTEVEHPANDRVLGEDEIEDPLEHKEAAQADARGDAMANHAAEKEETEKARVRDNHGRKDQE